MSFDHHFNHSSQHSALAMPQPITTSLHRQHLHHQSQQEQTNATHQQLAANYTGLGATTNCNKSQNINFALQSSFHHPTNSSTSNLSILSPNTVINPLSDLHSMKREKDLLCSHPLFNLLEIIFEKCELATTAPRHSNSINNDVCSAASFNEDITSFAKQFKGDKPIFTSERELDIVMIQAIQVLRFHLYEIEKVHELCDKFCKDYIEQLKTRIPLNLVMDEHNPNKAKTISEIEGSPSHAHFSVASPQQGSIQSWQLSHQTSATSSTHSSPLNVTDTTIDDDEEEQKNKKKSKKRGIFPKAATNVMKAWLFQNLTHPYPSEEQKRMLAEETGLTILQVNNWFINARRRIVQPMIDASSRSGKTPVVTVFKSRRRKPSGPPLGGPPSFNPMPPPPPPPPQSHVGSNYGMDHMQGPFYDNSGLPSLPIHMGSCSSELGLNPVVSASPIPLPIHSQLSHVMRGPTTSSSVGSHSPSMYLQHSQTPPHPMMMAPPPSVRGTGSSHSHHRHFLPGSNQPPSTSPLFQSADAMTQQLLDLHPS